MTTSVPSRAIPGQPAAVLEPVGGLLAEAPEVSRTDWLPPEGFPELDELRAEHLRQIEAAVAADGEINALRGRFEREDAAYAEAAKAQAVGQGIEFPELTPPEQRAAELAPVEARAKALHEAREEFTHRAIETIAEHYEEWATELDSSEGEAERRVEDARRALAEAEAAIGATKQLRLWLARTAGRDGRAWSGTHARHIAYPRLAGAGPEASLPPASAVEEIEGPPPKQSPEARALLLKERAARNDALTGKEF